MFNKSVFPLVLLFLVIATPTLIFRNFLNQHGFDWQVLNGGNIFLYIITSFSMSLLREGMEATTTQRFLTKVYGSILLKLFACAIAALIYIFIKKTQLNKPAFFTLMGLYLVYTFVEMKLIMKPSNQKKDVVR